jgi:hypothetical protein
MNARQSAKAAAKRIEELEFRVKINILDIRDYNTVIEEMIKDGSPCPWCEDYVECGLEAKADGRGCHEWILHNNAQKANKAVLTGDGMIDFKEGADESEGILSSGQVS